MSDDIEAVTSNTSCYYRVLGLCKQATSHDIRRAYRRLALVNLDANSQHVVFCLTICFCTVIIYGLQIQLLQKWHPDRWIKNPNSALAGEAKLRFQQVHEAYSGNYSNFSSSHLIVTFLLLSLNLREDYKCDT